YCNCGSSSSRSGHCSAGGRLSRAKVSTWALGPSAAAPLGAGRRGGVAWRPRILANMSSPLSLPLVLGGVGSRKWRAIARSLWSLGQLIGQVRFYRRPFAGDDAVDAGIAQRAVLGALVAAQDAVEFGSQPLDAAPARVIEEVRAEFDGDAIEPLESMREQQELALRVDFGALGALAIPSRADLDALVDGIDIEKGRHADGRSGNEVDDGEGQHLALCRQPEAPVDLRAHLFGRRNCRVPEPPQLAVPHGLGEIAEVGVAEWFQPNARAAQGDGCEGGHGLWLLAFAGALSVLSRPTRVSVSSRPSPARSSAIQASCALAMVAKCCVPLAVRRTKVA